MADSGRWIGGTYTRVAYSARERRTARENRRIRTTDNCRSTDDFPPGGSSAQDLHGSGAMTLPQSIFREEADFSSRQFVPDFSNAMRSRQQSEKPIMRTDA